MAALAERYPGAPAHWLAHVAERTSQLAAAGEAPLSLNSDPAAWPTPRPETVGAAPGDRGDAGLQRRPAARDGAASRRRGSDPGRPERPVVRCLAAARPGAETAPPTGVRHGDQAPRPTRPAASDAAPRRSRAPLTFANPASPTVPSESVAATPDIPTAEAVLRQPAWSEAPPSRLMAPEPAKPWLDAQAAEGPSSDPSWRGRVWSPSSRSRWIGRKRISTEPPRRPPPVVPGPGSSRSPRPLAPIGPWTCRRSRGGKAMTAGLAPRAAITLDPASPPRPSHAYSTSERQAVAPGRIWRALTPAAARRALSLALAAFRPKPRARAVHAQASERTVVAAPLIDRPSPEPRRPAPSFTRPPTGVRRRIP